MGSYRRTFRKSKARRSTRRRSYRQQGGAYEAEALRNFLQNAPNFQRSVEMYNSMTNPCILNYYPQIMYGAREGQNGEDVPNVKFLVLISDHQPDEEHEEHTKRNIIYIIITAEDNAFLGATIDVIPKYIVNNTYLKVLNPASSPDFIHSLIDDEYGPGGSRHILYEGGDDFVQRTNANNTIMEALGQLYRQPGAEEGIGICILEDD
jgi:hypothetical protein